MIDLDSMSRKDLMQLRSDVDRAISSVADREARRALEAAENVAREHGYSLSDLMKMTGGKSGRGGRGSAGRGKAGSGAEAKYRHPDDASKTWSGRGRRPRWVHDHEANGGQLADLAV